MSTSVKRQTLQFTEILNMYVLADTWVFRMSRNSWFRVWHQKKKRLPMITKVLVNLSETWRVAGQFSSWRKLWSCQKRGCKLGCSQSLHTDRLVALMPPEDHTVLMWAPLDNTRLNQRSVWTLSTLKRYRKSLQDRLARDFSPTHYCYAPSKFFLYISKKYFYSSWCNLGHEPETFLPHVVGQDRILEMVLMEHICSPRKHKQRPAEALKILMTRINLKSSIKNIRFCNPRRNIPTFHIFNNFSRFTCIVACSYLCL